MRHFELTSLGAGAVLVFLLAISPTSAPAQGETLTNDEVVAMLKAGIGPTVIVNKIRTSQTKFDLSTQELIRLRNSGVNDEILQAMQGYSESAERRGTPAPVVDPNDPATPHSVGIYLLSDAGGQRKMTELEPMVVTRQRTSGSFGTSMTYGIWKTRVKTILPGVHAAMQTTEDRPVFYFYLNEKDRTMAGVKYFPSSVSQFQMVRFDIKDRTREVTVAKSNSYLSKSGIADNFVVAFDVENVGDGIFKVTPKAPLKTGEYGFYLIGTGDSVGATFYDFGVIPRPPKF